MIKQIRIKVSLFILICTLPLALAAQLSSREIDALVEDAMDKFNVAGVAVGVVKDGNIVHARGYGVTSIKTGKKVDEHTSFGIASNSKAFTTAALAILVEEGKISWTDRVVDHIPEFQMYNDYVTRNFNIVDLLVHRSGLGLGAGDLQFWPSGSDFSIGDMLSNFQHFKPVSAFRTKYDYDNILYMVAGELIKRVSGENWGTFVRKRILEPLGMNHTFTLPPDMIDSPNLAFPHMEVDGKLELISFFDYDPEKVNGAAAGVVSNVDDLCRWMLLHLNRGKYGPGLQESLFTEDSHNFMWRIHTPMTVRPDERYNSHFAGYGLGWRLEDMAGHMSVSHTGDVSGMLSKTIMFPDLGLGVVVLTNSYYGGGALFQAVSKSITDGYLGLEPYDWTAYYLERQLDRSGKASDIVAKVWEHVESGDHHGVIPENYVGEYEDPWFGEVSISEKDGQLWFSSRRSPRLSGPMFHYKANAFAIRWTESELDADAFAIFSLDEEGLAQEIKMKGISPDLDFSYDFQDLHFSRNGER